MKKTPQSLRLLLPLFTAARLVLTTSFRMVYPLLPAFRDGLGVSFEAISRALAGRSLAAAIGPFVASLADSRGRKTGMLVGLVLFVFGAAIVIFWPTFPGFVLALVFTGLGKFVFDPAIQAYLGDRVPYSERGLMLTIIEIAWSGSFVLGIPLMSRLIARNGWLAPFPLLATLAILFIILFAVVLPKDNVEDARARQSLAVNLRSVLASKTAIMGLSFTLFAAAANESINLVFSVWLEASLGLRLSALGAAAVVIGFAEIGGEGLVAALVDRIGKRKAILFGLSLNSLATLLLPVVGRSQAGALIGLFFVYITFEFAFVSSIPLMTEILPKARATVMSLNITAASLGRAIASFAAPVLYSFGFAVNIWAAILFNALAFAALRQVRISAEGE
jgi:predicted MFS family arabinose efflux permease